ncbi:hypothetical protein BWR17_09760 [Phaeobacter inhibens]|uniref:hypothetical protein n=1 Tax=Phaeobacter inhibens TaxID=221822 RepID=UPI000971ABDC|nr:hypothetical protein [Phaeobacter inhibens]APX16092.1 hypothetical protein BWR17_09760 [Phaeobacter inhibens]
MTWHGFKRFTIRLNFAVLGTCWLAFWGYGFWVADLPPISVVPGLLLMSVLLSIVLCICAFWGCHTWLYLRAKRTGELANLTKRDYNALTIGIVSGVVLAGLAFAEISERATPDGIAVPLAIVAAATAILSLLYWALAVGAQYFRWQFNG